ncbi:kinase [Pseudoalteromonas sp. MMG022]|uniref:kinase n=1 Tax=Pseudoalteromonas sp. MMG022 TaxID=2909978 RepID=UPI001F47E41F|nr:kinase [Pseudoalteromonas sp. MMG022]MCF6435792.1 kinase [Pseudoalteromonas sp. MMG022]
MTPWQQHFIVQHQLPPNYVEDAQPICIWLRDLVKSAPQPLCIGINGAQGSGKSTLAAFLAVYLRSLGYTARSVSLDDFYLSPAEREKVANQHHPLFKTRGVPGTHNVAMLQSILRDFKHQKPITLPSFDKSTDTPEPKHKWLKCEDKLEILLLEGWCLGLSKEPDERLHRNVNDFERRQDSNGKFRTQVNQFLGGEYHSAFAGLDKLIYLNVESFERVFEWRLKQEQQLVTKAKVGMTKSQVYDFIQYFQRLTEWGVESLPQCCDLHVKVRENHRFAVESLM